ncbi:MAG: hypothetical protein K2Y27_18930 [Xanthobacteraceae bacterium]|nr:hypothetical protein [Xanthobacteraceae bacterium]
MILVDLATMADAVQPAFWQRYGNAAQIASAVLAIAALAGIYFQVQANFRVSRENSAREIYRAYLQMAVQHPQLAYPENAAVVAAMSRDERARYGWFVSYLLYTCEQILVNFPRDATWRRTCQEQVAYHTPYICSSVVKDEINHYDPAMRGLIEQVARSSAADECKKGT